MFLYIRDLNTSSLAGQHFNFYSAALPQARAIFEPDINRRWGLAAARTWAQLLLDRIHIPVWGFDDEMELGAQAHQHRFYYSRYLRTWQQQ
jgi:hypothetical protein